MPLSRGTSPKSVEKNIHTLMHEYEETGRIGRTKPASPAKARQIAVAIALAKQRESERAKAKAKKAKKRGK